LRELEREELQDFRSLLQLVGGPHLFADPEIAFLRMAANPDR
jgi:hypothetical protein